MKNKNEKKSLPQRSEFMEQLELRTGKGIPINQIPCIYAIAHQNRCLIFGFVTLCPLRCPKFRIGAPVEEENEQINTWCKFLEKVDDEYLCSADGQMLNQINCQICPIFQEDKVRAYAKDKIRAEEHIKESEDRKINRRSFLSKIRRRKR
ncbi:MAG: hypothetical protein ACFFDI_00260 [Promethearchaeota archaeon]